MKNEKGLTLIELIVSMLILSIASLMFYASFTVVLRTMKEGEDIKNASAEIVSIIDGNASDNKENPIVLKNNTARGNITLSNGSVISVEGTGYNGTKPYGKDSSDYVNLQKFMIKKYTFNEKNAIELSNMLDSVEGNGLSSAFVNNLSETEKKNIAAEIGRTSFWASNDVFIDYLYKKYFKEFYNVESYVWPTIDITKMKVKNGTYITEIDKNLSSNLYVVPYYIDPTNGVYLLSGRKTPAIEKTNWDAYLIFNDDDRHWYYSKTPYGLTKLTNKTDAEWSDLKKQMLYEQNGWQRVYEDE